MVYLSMHRELIKMPSLIEARELLDDFDTWQETFFAPVPNAEPVK